MKTLVLFVKQPVPGRVKTRLAVDLGAELAASLYAAFAADLVNRLHATADRRVLAFTPNEAAARRHFEILAGGRYELWPQPEVELGRRLAECFADMFAAGASRVVVIGSDSPLLPVAVVEQAFAALDDRDCVLGPATDGGYYLVGLRRPIPEMFRGIDWSGPLVLSQTIDRLGSVEGAMPSLLQPWYDVDTLADLVTLRGHVRALRAAGTPTDLPALEPLLADPALDAAILAAIGTEPSPLA